MVQLTRTFLRCHPESKRLSCLFLVVLGLVGASSIHAAAPVLDQLYPIAVGRGVSNLVSAAGAPGTWPPQIWVSAPGIQIIPQTNSGSLMVFVENQVALGPYWLRFYNAEGSSQPRFLVVTERPDEPEREPNDDRREPQPIASLPTIVGGRLDKSGDVDSFSVHVLAGQTLVARIEAYVLASPVDAVMRIVDSRGVQLVLNHDDGMTFDPWTFWTAREDGDLVIQVFGFPYPANSDVRFHGSSACVYRLKISTDPWVRYTLPLGVVPGIETELRLEGWNLKEPKRLLFSGNGLRPDSRLQDILLPGFQSSTLVAVGQGIEQLESPSLQRSNRVFQLLPIPSAVTGCIDPLGEVDRYRIVVLKSEKLLIAVQSEAFGFPLDAVLWIEDLAGKELARSDDSTGKDPSLEWTGPADGEFVVSVANLLHRAGPDHLYRLSVERPTPTLRPRVSAHQFVFKSDSTNEISIALNRSYGHASKLRASLEGLPPGVVCDPVDVTEQAGEVKLRCVVLKTALAYSGVVEGRIQELGTNTIHPIAFDLVTSGSDNGVPNGFQKLLIRSVEQLWLTLQPASPPK